MGISAERIGRIVIDTVFNSLRYGAISTVVFATGMVSFLALTSLPGTLGPVVGFLAGAPFGGNLDTLFFTPITVVIIALAGARATVREMTGQTARPVRFPTRVLLVLLIPYAAMIAVMLIRFDRVLQTNPGLVLMTIAFYVMSALLVLAYTGLGALQQAIGRSNENRTLVLESDQSR